VKTPAWRPYGVPFARASASSSESTASTVQTGPKTSSHATLASGGAPAITVGRLLDVLETLPEGASELGCHPGYANGLRSRYVEERETELATLTDPRVGERIEELGIALIGWADL
jgi:predicted glycoside hydrolase/deacetylase ChbG (UPF0249 family)